MTTSMQGWVRVPADVLVQELQGEAVLLNIRSGQYFGLDEIGARMWSVLTTVPSFEAARETLLAEYDVDAAQLEQDLRALLDKLLEHGLLEPA